MNPISSNLRVAAALLAAGLVAGCGNWQRVGEVDRPNPEQEVSELFDPTALYNRLGRIVGSGQISFVGSAAFLPGPGDSTVAVVAISLPNRAFAFEKSAGAFAASYRVEYELDRPGSEPVIVGGNKTLRVTTFNETLRTDESVIEQQKITVAPGAYTLAVRVRDLTNSGIGSGSLKVTAPSFTPGTYTAPILVYSVQARANRNDSISIVLNPRGSVAYGGDTLLAYIEAVGFNREANLAVQIRNARDSIVGVTRARFGAAPVPGPGAIESGLIRVAPNQAPLGRLGLAIAPPATAPTASSASFALAAGGDLAHETNALVSFSSQWVVTNFDDLLNLLRYFGEAHRVDAMRRAKDSDRITLWQDFVKATDPDPSTPENERLEQYFGRIAIANQQFREPGRPGWRTDRGEVFIALGTPDEAHDQSAQLQNPQRYYVWFYQQYALTLYFQDITGFGRFELTPQARADFNRIRLRVQGVEH